MTRAVIDLGTNSLKCVIASVEKGSFSVLRDFSQVTRLGECLQKSGSIGSDAMQRNLKSLKDIASICRELETEFLLCVGCATLRRSADADVFRSLVCKELGWQLHTLSAEEEARLTFAASAYLAPPDLPCAVIDIGGGSTELAFGGSTGIHSGISLPLGAVTLTSGFIHSDPIKQNDLQDLQYYIRQQLAEVAFPPQNTFAIACGGSATSLASVLLGLSVFDQELVEGKLLSKEELQRQIELYSVSGLETRKEIVGLDPDRADIILSGAILLQEIMLHFGWEQVAISTRGIRHALLLDETYWEELISSV